MTTRYETYNLLRKVLRVCGAERQFSLLRSMGYSQFCDVPDEALELLSSLANNLIHKVQAAQAVTGFVDRMVNLKLEHEEHNDEYAECMKDLRIEITSRKGETGVSVKQVADSAKIRITTQKDREAKVHALHMYEKVYGFALS